MEHISQTRNFMLLFSVLILLAGCIGNPQVQKDIEWCKTLQEQGGAVCFDMDHCDDIAPQRSCLLYMAVTKYNDSRICDEIPEEPLLGWTGSESHWVIHGAPVRDDCLGYFNGSNIKAPETGKNVSNASTSASNASTGNINETQSNTSPAKNWSAYKTSFVFDEISKANYSLRDYVEYELIDAAGLKLEFKPDLAGWNFEKANGKNIIAYYDLSIHINGTDWVMLFYQHDNNTNNDELVLGKEKISSALVSAKGDYRHIVLNGQQYVMGLASPGNTSVGFCRSDEARNDSNDPCEGKYDLVLSVFDIKKFDEGYVRLIDTGVWDFTGNYARLGLYSEIVTISNITISKNETSSGIQSVFISRSNPAFDIITAHSAPSTIIDSLASESKEPWIYRWTYTWNLQEGGPEELTEKKTSTTDALDGQGLRINFQPPLELCYDRVENDTLNHTADELCPGGVIFMVKNQSFGIFSSDSSGSSIMLGKEQHRYYIGDYDYYIEDRPEEYTIQIGNNSWYVNESYTNPIHGSSDIQFCNNNRTTCFRLYFGDSFSDDQNLVHYWGMAWKSIAGRLDDRHVYLSVSVFSDSMNLTDPKNNVILTLEKDNPKSLKIKSIFIPRASPVFGSMFSDN